MVNVVLIVGLTILVIIIVMVVKAVLARRKAGGSGTQRIMRCADGHLFTSTVIPGASFKAVRLGTKRYQHCPVGDHMSLVASVDPDTLTPEERASAASVHDTRVP